MRRGQGLQKTAPGGGGADRRSLSQRLIGAKFHKEQEQTFSKAQRRQPSAGAAQGGTIVVAGWGGSTTTSPPPRS